jgi:hypothetical protein
MKKNLLLIAIACGCFTLASLSQTENSMLRDLEGEWIFESAELQERQLNSVDAYTKKTLTSSDEIFAGTHFSQTPLSIQFEPFGEMPTMSLNNPVSGYDNMRFEWIREKNNFRLNLLQAPKQSEQEYETQDETPETMKIVASYFDVKVSLGRELTMKYNYAYDSDEDNHVEGILTVCMKKKMTNSRN